MNKRTDRRPGRAVAAIAPPATARGARTRSALKRAARVLFEKHGFQNTSVNLISARARVAHGTFYTYFDSKEQIFAEITADMFAGFHHVMFEQPRAPGDGLSHRIERANRGFLAAYCDNAQMMAAVEQAATLSSDLAEIRRLMRVGWIDRNAAAIRRWQKRGEVSEHVEPRAAAEILGCMVDRTAYVWIVLDQSFELEGATRQLTRLYCNALGLSYFRDDPTRSRALARRSG